MAQQKDIKTGKWMYYGSYIDVDGKRKQYKKRGYDTKKEARLAEDKFRNETENQKIHINFDDLCNRFISFQAKRVKKATLETDIFLMNSIKKVFNVNIEIEPHYSNTSTNATVNLLKSMFLKFIIF
mgnify:CR=1 FL=1